MVKRIEPKKKEKFSSPFEDILDEGVRMWNAGRMAERGNKSRSMYASDYGQCMRKICLQFFPLEYSQEDFEPRTLRIFHNGENVHERLSNYFHLSPNYEFLEEIDIPRDNLDIHGRCDGIVFYKGKFVVVEFKSINSSYVREAKDEHEGQLTWYMFMWESRRRQMKIEAGLVPDMTYDESELKEVFENWDDLDRAEQLLLMSNAPVTGEIIYESKHTQELFHFPMEIEDWRVNKVKRWYEDLKCCVENRTIPNVNYNRNKFPCRWRNGRCAYWEVCHGSDSELKSANSEDI